MNWIERSEVRVSSRRHRATTSAPYVLRLRWIIVSVSLVVLLGLVTWWTIVATRDDGTLAEIQRRGTLRVGLDASFPPFETIDENSRIVGLDVDIARTIARDLGVELELVNIGFDGLYDALLARRADIIISGLPYDPRWTQDVAYTANYFNAGQILVTRTAEATVDEVDDLEGRTVAVEWGSQADMEARRLERSMTGLTILRRSTAEEALQSLLAGQADAAVVDAVSGVRAVPKGVSVVTYLTDEWYAAAVHIESTALLEAVNQSLTRLNESGEMARIQALWLHER
jgi:polar amino acid transport system substrate-binding protein